MLRDRIQREHQLQESRAHGMERWKEEAQQRCQREQQDPKDQDKSIFTTEPSASDTEDDDKW